MTGEDDIPDEAPTPLKRSTRLQRLVDCVLDQTLAHFESQPADTGTPVKTEQLLQNRARSISTIAIAAERAHTLERQANEQAAAGDPDYATAKKFLAEFEEAERALRPVLDEISGLDPQTLCDMGIEPPTDFIEDGLEIPRPGGAEAASGSVDDLADPGRAGCRENPGRGRVGKKPH